MGPAALEYFCSGVVKLIARRDEFDGIFPGHGLVDLGSIMLVNILEACDGVIANPEAFDNKVEMTFGDITRIRYNKMIYESGYLSYGLSGV